MVPNRSLSIQDYFRKAGLRGDTLGVGREMRRPVPTAAPGFARTLAQARAVAPVPAPTGQGIVDYLRAPVASRLPPMPPPAPEQVLPPTGVTMVGGAFPEAKAQTLAGVAVTVADAPATPAAGGSNGAMGSGAGTVSERIERGIQRAAAQHRLPAGLIRSVIRAESNFEVRAVSKAGAQGLMQLMPATARELGVVDPFDIDQNIDGGARYLRRMLDRFNGDLELALSAYNAGPGKVMRYDGNVPYRETREYVRRVLAFHNGDTAAGASL